MTPPSAGDGRTVPRGTAAALEHEIDHRLHHDVDHDPAPADYGPANREWRDQIDPGWTLAATVLRVFERSGLVRNALFATAAEGAIRVEASARCLVDDLPGRARRDRRLPNWHLGGSGPSVIVLLNGWTASGLVWPAALVERLEANARVVRIDNRGTGWSHHLRRPFTIGDLADDVRDVLDALDVRQATVAGLSMGGMIAQEVAMRYPHRVRHLVLLATRPPNPEYTPASPDVIARLMSPPPAGEPLVHFMFRRWAGVTGPGFAEREPEAVQEMARALALRPTDRPTVLDQARAIAAWFGAGRLEGVDVPATVIHGESDPLIPVVNAMRLVQLLPQAEYVELPSVGHLVPYEAPTPTVEAIAAATS